jgi:hypothetical protein
MADNIDGETLNNPITPISENLQEETISSKDMEAVTKNQETENMEVHKHPHHVTHKKKWGEYLLEFFMLFLAVFLGFMAENIREHSVERHREKEYIVSLIQDLKTDTANLSYVIRVYESQHKRQDTLLMALDSLGIGYNATFIRLAYSVMGFPDFIYSDATMQQLKSAGGLRLIRNKKAVDSINAYSSEVNRTFINTDAVSKRVYEIQSAMNDFINFHANGETFYKRLSHDDKQSAKMDILISHNKEDQYRFYNKMASFQWLMDIVRNENFIPLKRQATSLISVLQKQYSLENE